MERDSCPVSRRRLLLGRRPQTGLEAFLAPHTLAPTPMLNDAHTLLRQKRLCLDGLCPLQQCWVQCWLMVAYPANLCIQIEPLSCSPLHMWVSRRDKPKARDCFLGRQSFKTRQSSPQSVSKRQINFLSLCHCYLAEMAPDSLVIPKPPTP